MAHKLLPKEHHIHFGEFFCVYLAFKYPFEAEKYLLLSKMITEGEWMRRNFHNTRSRGQLIDCNIFEEFETLQEPVETAIIETENEAWVYEQSESATWSNCMSKSDDRGYREVHLQEDLNDFKKKILLFWTIGKPPSMGHRLGFKSRAKLRIFRVVSGSSKDAWLFIDQVYGSAHQLVPNMRKLAQWWEKYCDKNGLIAREILRATIPRANPEYVKFYRIWKDQYIGYNTTKGGYMDHLIDGELTQATFRNTFCIRVKLEFIRPLAFQIIEEIRKNPTIEPYKVHGYVIFQFDALLHFSIAVANCKMVKRVLIAWKPTKTQINELFYWTELTPIQAARHMNDTSSMKLLIEYGALPTLDDKQFIEDRQRPKKNKQQIPSENSVKKRKIGN